MAKPKGGRKPLDPFVKNVLTFGLVALVVGAIFWWNARDDSPDLGGTRFHDVHGIAVHPDEPGTLFVATHRGLWKGGDAGWERVGASQDDFMGFTLHPRDADVAWSSGHPGPGSNVSAPSLGARKTTDGGLTWRTVALEFVDFHAMTVSPADPDRVWGYWNNNLYASQDGGQTWSAVGRHRLGGLAASPTDPATIYSGTGEAFVRSDDGGRTWATLAFLPARAVALAPDGSAFYAATGDGVSRSTDGGATWTELPLTPPQGSLLSQVAVSPSRPATVYAATLDGSVHRSDDAGETWRQVKPPG